MKNKNLTLDHVHEIVSQELTIGSHFKATGNSKVMSFQPSSGLYRVYENDTLKDISTDAPKMLDLYNSISV
jgi:hypothetical protein